MRLPNTEIDDLDLYQDFFDKLRENNITFKEFLVKTMENYLKDNSNSKQETSLPNHKADYLITEFAIRYIESCLSQHSIKSTTPQTSLHSVISDLCINLLSVIDTPKSHHLIQHFDQENAIEYLKLKIYN